MGLDLRVPCTYAKVRANVDFPPPASASQTPENPPLRVGFWRRGRKSSVCCSVARGSVKIGTYERAMGSNLLLQLHAGTGRYILHAKKPLVDLGY